MIYLLFLSVLLTGCASTLAAPVHPALNDRFPDYCDITQSDPSGTGYTIGQFPCHLKHVAGPEKGKP